MRRSPSVRQPSTAIARTRISAGSCWPSIPKNNARFRTCSRRTAMNSTSKWIAAVLLIAAPAFAADRYENQPRVSTTYRGGRITIEHSFGRVEVRTARGTRVDVQGIIRSSDEELGKQIHFDVSSTSNGVVIRSVYPRFHGFGSISWSADLQVIIPENAPLTLRDKFGSVEVSGLGAPSDIAN